MEDEKLKLVSEIMSFHKDVHSKMDDKWFSDLFDKLMDKSISELEIIIRFINKRKRK